MAAATENLYIDLPKSDLSFLRKLAVNMGWTLHREPKSGIEKGLEDIKGPRGIVRGGRMPLPNQRR